MLHSSILYNIYLSFHLSRFSRVHVHIIVIDKVFHDAKISLLSSAIFLDVSSLFIGMSHLYSIYLFFFSYFHIKWFSHGIVHLQMVFHRQNKKLPGLKQKIPSNEVEVVYWSNICLCAVIWCRIQEFSFHDLDMAVHSFLVCKHANLILQMLQFTFLTGV